MRPVRYTLLGDGSSDRALVPILDWLFRVHLPDRVVLEQGQVAALGHILDPPPLADFSGRIQTAVELYPCDVLFVHRDAEQRNGYAARRAEIESACARSGIAVPCLPVVPVRMTEAWLLVDEAALRLAADRPGGNATLDWPPLGRLERIHAKDVLFDLFRAAASETTGRRQRVPPGRRRARLATLISDFSPLRRLASFQDLERDIANFCLMWVSRP